MRAPTRACLLMIPGVLLAATPLAAQEGAAGVSREKMWDIYDALRSTFELSLSPAAYEDPANQPQILTGLERLAAETDRLEAHGRDVHESYAHLGGSLARDAETVLRRYQERQYPGSRFMLHKLTENCFACHAKLPSDRDYDLGDGFVGEADVNALAAEDLARLQVATRQFGAALSTYESILASTEESPAHLDYMGVLRDYLTVALRVAADPDRARLSLEALAARDDVPVYLASQLATWLKTLRSVRLNVDQGAELAAARRWIEQGRAVNRYPQDRKGTVHFIVASGILERFLVDGVRTPAERAEAYLLLGIAESHVAHSYWVSETEFFLESAIRADPSSPAAAQAHAVLTEYLTAAYSGSAGVQIPDDIVARLADLRELIDAWR